MNPQELQALMHGEIDGTNAAAESQRLHACLRGDAAARKHYEELCETIAVLEDVGLREPSPTLRRAILAAVEDLAPTAPLNTGAGGGLLHRWGAVLKNRPGYGYAFAAGLALGMLVLAALGPRLADLDAPPRAGLYGVALPGVEQPEIDAIVLAIDGPGVRGNIRSWHEGQRLVVRIDLDAADGVQVTFGSQPALVCEIFRALEAGYHELVTRPGSIQLNHAGRGSYEIELGSADRQPALVTVRVQREGVVLGEQVLALR